MTKGIDWFKDSSAMRIIPHIHLVSDVKIFHVDFSFSQYINGSQS